MYDADDRYAPSERHPLAPPHERHPAACPVDPHPAAPSDREQSAPEQDAVAASAVSETPITGDADTTPPPLTMDAETFERLVVDELDQLPDDMIEGLDNVVFVVEDRPEDGSLDLLGLYDGWALTERDRYGVGELPDRIILYREPHLAACADEGELRDEIHTTLVHEIAHFYGIDDERLHELGWA